MHVSFIILLVGLAATATLQLASFIYTRIQQDRKAKELGCEKAFSPPDFGILGWTNLRKFLDAVNTSRSTDFLVERWQIMSQTYGAPVGTYRYSLLGIENIHTVDPENIKALLATQFQDFEQGPIKRAIVQPVFGDGIFGQDGKKWEHSRAMLRVRIEIWH